MATPRSSEGHAHKSPDTPTSSILKVSRKPSLKSFQEPTKKVRFSEDSAPHLGSPGAVKPRPTGRDQKQRKKTSSGGDKGKADSRRQCAKEKEEGKEGSEDELEEGEYEVEAIIDHRKVPFHDWEYLIKWKGYPDSENTWVPLKEMDCHEILIEYRKKRRRQRRMQLAKPAEKKAQPAGRQESKKTLSGGEVAELNAKTSVRAKKEATRYEVDAVLEQRKVGGSKTTEYLVRWRGNPPRKDSWLPANRIAWSTLQHYFNTKVHNKSSNFQLATKLAGSDQPRVSKRTARTQSDPPASAAGSRGRQQDKVFPGKPTGSAELVSPAPAVKPTHLNGLSGRVLPVPNYSLESTAGRSAIVYIDHSVLDSPPPSPLTNQRYPLTLAPSPRLSPLTYRWPSRTPPHLSFWDPLTTISPVSLVDLSPSSPEGLPSPATPAYTPTDLATDPSPHFLSPVNSFHLSLDPDPEDDESPLIGGVSSSQSSPVILIDTPPENQRPFFLPPSTTPLNGIVRQDCQDKPKPLTVDNQCLPPSSKPNGFKYPTVSPGGSKRPTVSPGGSKCQTVSQGGSKRLTMSPGGYKRLEDLLRGKLATFRDHRDKQGPDAAQKTLPNGLSRNGIVVRLPLGPHDINIVDENLLTARTDDEIMERWSRSRLRKRSRSLSPPRTTPPMRYSHKRRCSPRLNGVTPSQLPPMLVALELHENHEESRVSMPVAPLPSPSPSLMTNERYQDQLLEWQYMLNKQRRGLEDIILVENTVDQAPLPTDFNYITSNIYTKDVPDPSNDDRITGCACSLLHKRCGPKAGTCCSHQAGAEYAYSPASKVKLPPGKPIYECNRFCSCRPDCNNRVVQHGRQVPLCIFRTSNGRGWGVKTIDAIKPNTFVAEYVGEVITTDEAERRGKIYDREGATYLFDLDFNDDPAFTIDAAKHGNISHFFNHSCDPNLVVYSVWINTLDPRLPRIAFFTTRNVSAGEELTFDYQMNHNQNTPRKTSGQVPCLCNAPNCIGFLD